MVLLFYCSDQKKKGSEMKSGVLSELPMRPERKKGGRMKLYCCGSLNI
jgi:hypothetical protein